MAHGIFQKLEQSQKQLLAPILQQNIQILLLNNIDLMQEINKRLDDNPFLEVTSEGNQDKELEQFINYARQSERKAEFTREEDFDAYKETIYEDSYNSYGKSSGGDSDENSKQSFLENTITHTDSLYDVLKSQLRSLELSEQDEYIADVIISCVNEYGILANTPENIAEYTKTTLEKVEEILKKIQELEPAGVGARDGKEFILLQIEKLYGENTNIYRVAKEYFTLFEKYEPDFQTQKEKTKSKDKLKEIQYNAQKLRKKIIKEIAVNLNYRLQDIENILKKIEETVVPNPTMHLELNQENISYIIPDIIVTVNQEDQTVNVKVFDDYLPQLKLNQEYKILLRKQRGVDATPAINELKIKYEEAKNFVNILKRRNNTLYDLTMVLLDVQKEFFIRGSEFIKPLTIKEMAETLNLHESTISRIVNNKYISTPYGIFPLKYLFSHHIDGNNEDVSAKKVGEMIKKIVEKEGHNKKLSDDKICKILNNMGIKISRRTISKYRKKLNIRSSFDR
ncbi:MAG TPA: RNA polymerase sigma-54 factor [Spirochaetia bacterium]|nr:MAG: RNA polymerase sigma-54 factor [Spirochaetes bacterium GWB1_36_13]HCL56281.1 RNA polymerase sigma-54 factor [Spirochaetia bacterium]